MANKKSVRTILIVERAWQVKEFMASNKPSDCTWIAFGPEAIHALEREAISYKIPEEFYELDELFPMYERALRTIDEICAIGDRALWGCWPELAQKKLEPFHFNIYPLILGLETIFRRAFELERIIADLKPGSILIHRPDSDANSSVFPFATEELVASKVLLQNFSNLNVQAIEFRNPESKSRHLPMRYLIKEKIKDIFGRDERLYNVFRSLSDVHPRDITFKRWKKTSVVVFGDEYNWDYCKNMFAEKGISVIGLADRAGSFRRPTDQLVTKVTAAIEREIKTANLLSFENFDFSPLLRAYWKNQISAVAPACLAAYRQMSDLCSRKHTKAFLSAGLSSALGHSAAIAAKDHGIPSITWTHGGAGFFKHNFVPRFDFMLADYSLVWGNGVKQTYISQAKALSCELVPVGSAQLDTLFDKEAKQNDSFSQDVLFVTMAYQKNSEIQVSPCSPASYNVFYNKQSVLINKLSSIDNINLTVKLHPGLMIDDPPWVPDLPSTVKVIKRQKSAAELLAGQPIVVLDLASTVILQSLAHGCAIFLLYRDKVFVPGALEMLRKRVACFQEPEELAAAIKDYVNTGEYPADLNDRTFLREYGTYLDDGRSAERAVDQVLRIISQSS